MSVTAASLVAEIGVNGEVAAGAKLAAFGAQVDRVAAQQVVGAQKLGGAFSTVDRQLAGFGVPFTGALGAMGSQLEATSTKGASSLKLLSSAGTAAAVGLGVVGAESLHLADNFDQAHARLVTAAQTIGLSLGATGAEVEATDKKMVGLGFSSTETEGAIAALIPATKSVAGATRLMGEDADLARFKHESLGVATQTLVAIEGGRLKGLASLGISSKDAAGKTIDVATAIQRVSDAVSGQGAAYLDTYAGKTAVMGAKADEVAVKLGGVEKTAIEHVADATYAGVVAFEGWNRATDGTLGKMVALTAGASLVATVGAKVVTTAQGIAGAFTLTSASQGLAAAGAGELATAQQLEATAAAEAFTAQEALDGALISATATEQEVGAAAAEAAVAQDALAAASARVAAAETAVETGSIGAAAGMGALATGGLTAAVAIGAVAAVMGGMKLDQHAHEASGLGEALQIGGRALASLVPGGTEAADILGLVSGKTKDKTSATSKDQVASAASAETQRILAQVQADVAAATAASGAAADAGAGSIDRLDLATKRLNGDLATHKANLDVASSQISLADAYDSVTTAQAALTQARQDAAGVGQQAISAAKAEQGARQSLVNALQGEQTATQSLIDAKSKLAQFDGPTDTTIRSLERTQIVDRVITNPEEARQKQIDLLTFDENTTQKRADLQKQVGTAEAGVVSATQQVANAQLSVSDAVKARQKVQADATAAIIVDERKVEQAVIGVANAQIDVSSKILAGMSAAAAGAKAVVDQTSGLSGAALKTAEQNAALAATGVEVQALDKQFPSLRGEIDKYATSLGLIPTTVETQLKIDMTQPLAELAFTEASLRGLGVLTSAGPGGPVGAVVHGAPHAAGGTMAPGEWGTAGEPGAGTELLHALPGGGIEIFNQGQTARMRGGGNAEMLDELRAIKTALANQKPPISSSQTNVFHGVESPAADLEYANREQGWRTSLLAGR